MSVVVVLCELCLCVTNVNMKKKNKGNPLT